MEPEVGWVGLDLASGPPFPSSLKTAHQTIQHPQPAYSLPQPVFPSLRKRRSKDGGSLAGVWQSCPWPYFWQPPHSMTPLVSWMAVWCTNTGYSVSQGCSTSCFLCLWAVGTRSHRWGKGHHQMKRALGSHAYRGLRFSPAKAGTVAMQWNTALSACMQMAPLSESSQGL